MSTTPPFASRELGRVRRNRWVLALAAWPALLGMVAILAGISVSAAFFVGVLPALTVMWISVLGAWRRNPRPVVEQTVVRADATGVHVGELHIPRADIHMGVVRPGRPPRVLLRRKRGLPIELDVSSVDEGRGLLCALGLDVTQTVVRFRVSVGNTRVPAGVVGGIVLGLCIGSANSVAMWQEHPFLFMGGAFALASAWGWLARHTASWLSVGADGIVVARLGRKRFIGYIDIQDIARCEKAGPARENGVTLALRSGEELTLAILDEERDNVGALVEERLREAMATHRGGGTAADAATLRRGSRDVGSWVSALRAMGAGANADMRTASLPRERLVRIVEDPQSPAPLRAAAAVALGADLDDDARARLRSLAAATAAPKLRVVIEAAASSVAEAELEAALADLEQAEERLAAHGR